MFYRFFYFAKSRIIVSVRPSGRSLKLGEKIMTIEGLIIWLVIGAVAGWLAGLLVKGRGFGVIGNIVVGIVGAFIGGLLLPQLFVIGGILGSLVYAFIGAVILLVLISFIKRK
jgi:uncharacterized membrane protein YeaQ/YmgE (transglycosylase-associated protein family)